MKFSILLLSAAAAFLPDLRTRHSTANGAAKADPSSEIADLAAKFETLQQRLTDAQNTIATQQAQLDAQRAVASAPVDALGLGALKLPAGIDPKDVLWRKSAGLSLQQAVQAAVAQKRHDDAKSKTGKG